MCELSSRMVGSKPRLQNRKMLLKHTLVSLWNFRVLWNSSGFRVV